MQKNWKISSNWPCNSRKGFLDSFDDGTACGNEASLDGRVSIDEGTYQPINAYSMLGNCRSAVLVAPDGSIDWGCLPNFDSPALFCRLLDAKQGGYFQVGPVEATIPGVQSYLSGSNVLQTRFSCLTGEIVLTDFMPVKTLHAFPAGRRTNASPGHDSRSSSPPDSVIRQVACTYGWLSVQLCLKVTPSYAASLSNVTLTSDGNGAVMIGGEQYVGLFVHSHSHPDLPLQIKWDGLTPVLIANWTLKKGEELFFALGTAESIEKVHQLVEQELPACDFAAELEHTLECWRGWLARCSYNGPYCELVSRSGLTLKMMTYAPTGAIVAAPTTSLPEVLGGERNWDYRYTWLRDASFTLSALNRLGFTEEAQAFIHWLCSLSWTEDEGPQIMYGIRGERDLPEHELDHLSGYRDSPPVRIGNGAARQKQLDIFGEVLDGVYHSLRLKDSEGISNDLPAALWEKLCQLVEFVCIHWHEPDAGIWEVRGELRHYVYSMVMCWVALDRGICLAEQWKLPADLPRWRLIRDQIRLDVLTHGYNSQVRAFTQSYGSSALDAACLFLPLVGFIAADDPRMRSTVERIMEELTDNNGFVYRYRSDDGLRGAEGTFLMCTFWLVDNLAMQGRVIEARTLFERVLQSTGKLGLFSEEIDTDTYRALGNYPQAFSHLALIHSALNLQRAQMRLDESRASIPLVAMSRMEM